MRPLISVDAVQRLYGLHVADKPAVSADSVGVQGRGASRLPLYLLLSLLLSVGLLIQQFNGQWSRDVFVHIAGIDAFADAGLSPSNPFTGLTTPDAYLTPFHLLGGLIQGAFGWDITNTLLVLAMLNLALLLFALRAFVRLVTLQPLAPTFALLFTLLAWGISPWRWSGYLNLGSIGYGLPYPSVFSIAVGLLSIVALVRYLRGESYVFAVAAAAGGTLALLCHPLTALWLGAVALAFVVDCARDAPRKRLAVALVAGAGAALVALTWPYYSLIDVAIHSSGWEQGNQGLYDLIGPRAFLALPGALALWLRLRRNRTDPLALGAVLVALLYLVGIPLGRGTLGRTFPGLMLMLHVAFADLAAKLVQRELGLTRVWRRVGLVSLVAVLAIGLIGVAPVMLRTVPRPLLPGSLRDDERLASVVSPWRPLDSVLDRDDIVATTDDLADRVTAFGGEVLVPPANAPSLRPDSIVPRIKARNTILRSPLSVAGRRFRKRYGVTAVVVSTGRQFDRRAGRVILQTDLYRVIMLN